MRAITLYQSLNCLPWMLELTMSAAANSRDAVDGDIEHFIFIIPVFLHLVGFVLLYTSRHTMKKTFHSQYFYFINLSIAELIYSVNITVSSWIASPNVRIYNKAIRATTLFTWIILIMVFLTLDRFLEVYLNVRYFVFMSTRKTKFLLVICFVLAIACTAVIYVVSDGNMETHFKYAIMYVIPTFNGLFFIVSLFSYGYILKKIREKLSNVAMVKTRFSGRCRSYTLATTNNHLSNSNKTQTGTSNVHLYAPTLLVASFFLLCLLPFMAWSFLKIYEIELDVFEHYVYVSFSLNYSFDAVIYVFTSKPIRNVIYCKYKEWFKNDNFQSESTMYRDTSL